MVSGDLPSTGEKYSRLLALLRQVERLAVACSGGVDSTLLLHASLTALPPERVTAWHCRSSLGSARSYADYQRLLAGEAFAACQHRELSLNPLDWPELVENTPQRCYLCKKKMYQALLAAITDGGRLADGTNCDDLHADRPGLQAIRELGVWTPLVEAGLSKADIRQLAREKGLLNHDWPSNSCLATRIGHGQEISEDGLRTVEAAEEFLARHGFSGCRVRLSGSWVVLEVGEADLPALLQPACRRLLLDYFRQRGLKQIALNLEGR